MIGQSVMTKNFGGVIAEQIGPLMYVINFSDDRLWKRHVDHIKQYSMPHPCPEPEDIGNDDTTQATTEPGEPAIGLTEFLPQDGPETRVEIESNGVSPLVDLPPNIILPHPHSPARNAISDPSPPRRDTPHHSPIG